MGIKRIDTKLCNGCGICVTDCPMDVLRMEEKSGKAYPAYPRECWECFLCEEICPVKAIEITSVAARKLWFAY